MNTKSLCILSFLQVFSICTFFGYPAAAQTVGGVPVALFESELYDISFLVPSDANVLEGATPTASRLPAGANAGVIVRVEVQDQVLQVERFDLQFNFEPNDWLLNLARFGGWEITKLQGARNQTGMMAGRLDYIDPDGTNLPTLAFLVMRGSYGYLIRTNGAHANDLAVTVVSQFTATGIDWDEHDETRTVSFAGSFIEIPVLFKSRREDFDDTDVLVLHDGETDGESAVIIVAKQNISGGHAAHVEDFAAEVKSLGISAQVVNEADTETVLAAETRAGDPMLGIVRTFGDSSVSLIVPDPRLSSEYYLYGKYYFARVAEALQ